ncbi:MAG: hypothetical protein H6Q52_3687 [Deltaproteobacteria bacterium]|nr:hypothetical protein [Deltaproteobacteria bacterium]
MAELFLRQLGHRLSLQQLRWHTEHVCVTNARALVDFKTVVHEHNPHERRLGSHVAQQVSPGMQDLRPRHHIPRSVYFLGGVAEQVWVQHFHIFSAKLVVQRDSSIPRARSIGLVAQEVVQILRWWECVLLCRYGKNDGPVYLEVVSAELVADNHRSGFDRERPYHVHLEVTVWICDWCTFPLEVFIDGVAESKGKSHVRLDIRSVEVVSECYVQSGDIANLLVAPEVVHWQNIVLCQGDGAARNERKRHEGHDHP